MDKVQACKLLEESKYGIFGPFVAISSVDVPGASYTLCKSLRGVPWEFAVHSDGQVKLQPYITIPLPDDSEPSLGDIVKAYVIAIIEKADTHRHAAKMLGVSRWTLARMIKRWGLQKPSSAVAEGKG